MLFLKFPQTTIQRYNFIHFQSDKMTSLPVAPPPSPSPPTSKSSTSKPMNHSKSGTVKKVRVCANRSGRTIVKPVRVPIVIDIRNMRQEPPKVPPPLPCPPPPQLTLSQRFRNLSRDAAWAAFAFAKRKSLTQMRKVRRPRLDSRKLRKVALYGTPVVTLLIGYIYGKSR